MYQFIPDVRPYGSYGAEAVSTPSSSALDPPQNAARHCHRCPLYRLFCRSSMMAEVSSLCQAKAIIVRRKKKCYGAISRFLERSTGRSDYGRRKKEIMDQYWIILPELPLNPTSQPFRWVDSFLFLKVFIDFSFHFHFLSRFFFFLL